MLIVIKVFPKIDNDFQPSIIFVKTFILRVLKILLSTYRSSRPEVFYEGGVL